MPHKREVPPSFDKTLTLAEQAKRLREELNAWGHAYYVEDNPLVPDQVYDAALRELRSLEEAHPELITPDSPTHRVGAKAREGFEKYQHQKPMLSLANAYSIDDVKKFFERAARYLDRDSSDFDSVVEEKMDGLALSLTYEDGVLSLAATRGDGESGELVTENIRTLGDVPLRLRPSKYLKLLPPRCEIRGEVYIEHADFAALNDGLLKKGQKTFANPRNAAAGSLRMQDSKIVATRPLRFFAYQISDVPLNQSEVLVALKELGFRVNPLHTKIKNANEFIPLVEKYERLRREGKSKYDIDGLVIKIDDYKTVRALGFISNSPRSAIAYKLSPLEVITKVEKIETQVGRTGALTPVAHLTPVQVGGVSVSRATLHNEDQIKEKDVRVGDEVWIRRAGDVIPEIVRVNLEKRSTHSEPFRMPKLCPSCGTKLTKEKSAWRCPNRESCPAQVLERLRHFCSRGAMDIRGLGDQWIEAFNSLGFLHKVSDLYDLHEHREELVNHEGLGEKSVSKMLEAVEASKEQSAARFLFGLGIDLIGETTAEELVQSAGSLDRLFSMSVDELDALPNIGRESAVSMHKAFSSPAFRKEIENFKNKGLKKAFETQKNTSNEGPLKGLSFVVTGTLSESRDEVKARLKSLGASVSESVSKNTSYLLAGEKAGSKLTKAQSLGVKIISESDLKELLKEK